MHHTLNKLFGINYEGPSLEDMKMRVHCIYTYTHCNKWLTTSTITVCHLATVVQMVSRVCVGFFLNCFGHDSGKRLNISTQAFHVGSLMIIFRTLCFLSILCFDCSDYWFVQVQPQIKQCDQFNTRKSYQRV